MEILKWAHSMLGGSSPKTGYLGSITIALSVMQLMQETIAAEGMPSSKLGWIALALGIAARLAKDADRTNSQHPSAVAVPVPTVSASPVTVAVPAKVD